MMKNKIHSKSTAIRFRFLNSPLLTRYSRLSVVQDNNQDKKVSIFPELTKVLAHMLANGLRNVKRRRRKPKKRFK